MSTRSIWSMTMEDAYSGSSNGLLNGASQNASDCAVGGTDKSYQKNFTPIEVAIDSGRTSTSPHPTEITEEQARALTPQ